MLTLINKMIRVNHIHYDVNEEREFFKSYFLSIANGTTNASWGNSYITYTAPSSGTYQFSSGVSINTTLGPGTYVTHSGVTIVVP